MSRGLGGWQAGLDAFRRLTEAQLAALTPIVGILLTAALRHDKFYMPAPKGVGLMAVIAPEWALTGYEASVWATVAPEIVVGSLGAISSIARVRKPGAEAQTGQGGRPPPRPGSDERTQ